MTVGAEPTPDQLDAANHYRRELETECRAAGFGSLKEFEDANCREIAGNELRQRYVCRDGTIFMARFLRFWKTRGWAVPVGSIIGASGAYRDDHHHAAEENGRSDSILEYCLWVKGDE